jgi:hypothetical protein
MNIKKFIYLFAIFNNISIASIKVGSQAASAGAVNKRSGGSNIKSGNAAVNNQDFTVKINNEYSYNKESLVLKLVNFLLGGYKAQQTLFFNGIIDAMKEQLQGSEEEKEKTMENVYKSLAPSIEESLKGVDVNEQEKILQSLKGENNNLNISLLQIYVFLLVILENNTIKQELMKLAKTYEDLIKRNIKLTVNGFFVPQDDKNEDKINKIKEEFTQNLNEITNKLFNDINILMPVIVRILENSNINCVITLNNKQKITFTEVLSFIKNYDQNDKIKEIIKNFLYSFIIQNVNSK